MQKIVIEKSVAEEIKKKLASYEQGKNEKKACESGDFVEKMQNLALTEENEQKLSKLQASENIFTRGDFDEYKIKNMGVTPDGQVYDLDNPTEKFYYDLKMKFADSDKADDIEKSTKYIKRWFSNGEWHYKYPAKYSASQNRTKTKIDIAKETKLIQGIQPLENLTEKEIDEALLNLSLYAMDGKLKCPALGNHSVYITNRTQEHIKETHGQLRTDSEMKHKAKYIPFVPEILKNGKICEKSSSKQGVIYGIIGQVKYFDKNKNKSVTESLELAINYDKDLRKFVFSFADKTIKKSLFNYKDFNDHFSAGPMVDTETVPITIYSLSDLPKKSSKNITKSLFTDWKVELHHLCDKKGLNYDSVIQKYDDKLTRYVAEEQLHQDAENVIAYKAYKDLNKSLTYSGYKLQGRTRLYGMDISIENKKGTYRKGVDSDGHKWKTLMHYDYGYIRGTVGTDSDHVDCYIGPDKNSKKVYVIHQNNPITHKYDEDKCMLCFESADAAKKAYMKQYDRPGFFGSMETLTVEQFKTFVFSKQGSKIHKSFNVEVTDITENNKYKKVEQVEKTLRAIYNNVPFVINHIDTKGDNSEKYQNITLGITDFNKEKIEKAVHSIALALDVEPNVSNKGEPFLYKAQEDFTNNMIKEILKETKKIYLFVIDYFNLPDIRVISKANLRHKGKIVYNPETGKPITKKEWEKFLKEYEKLCQKIYGNFGEKLVMSSEVVGRMLDKITQKYPMEKVKKMSLKEMESLSKMTVAKLTVPKVFYQTFSKETYFRNRIELAEMSATNLITSCNENAKNKIKQILIDGVKNKDNKSKIGQQIFERCVGLNTDIQRIVDTEIQNNVNAAIIRSNVENKKENEKIYFKRSEIIDKVTCKKCKAIKGMVVLFSENPLTDEKIKDQYAEYAIWEGKTEGKVPFATMHPYCRGTWYRYYPRVVKK